jgi:FlaA1/EpsC-like NDP-sugar epimerase
MILSIVNCTLFHLLPESNGTGSAECFYIIPHLLLLIVCGAVTQYFFKTYDSLWRYAESKEYLILIASGGTGFVSFLFLDQIVFASKISIMLLIIAYLISMFGMLLERLCYHQYHHHNRCANKEEKIPLAIIGAGEAGARLAEEVTRNPNSKYQTLYFVDDSIEKIGKQIHNIEVKGPINQLDLILRKAPVEEIVVAMPSISAEKQREILKVCSGSKCRVRILPDTLALLQNEGEMELWRMVREIRIEELLGREPITLDNQEIEHFIGDKVIMVTGGGGSIGSELCRQIAKAKPERLVIIDIYENNAYDIQQELRQIYGDGLDIRIEIASVRDKNKVDQLFERHRPSIVFHAAAHKHVPLMEDCPEEAVLNNIFGTYHMVQASDRYNVEKFVLISTDKAVNPTSIMGASKRFCEMILQSMKESSKTEFVAVRFGNVLGSNGSVIPLFRKQIAQGGPVTITDRRMVRYFMTIAEAVQLVLQAGSMANDAEIYVLDMGQPVKIIDLAENLIRLSGYEPYTEIPIVETGLRPGEKLYEELLMNSNEELIATANHKIYIERQTNIKHSELQNNLELLSRSLETKSLIEIKKTLMLVVPTYREPEEVNAREGDTTEDENSRDIGE